MFELSMIIRSFTASVPTKPLNDAQMRGVFLYIYMFTLKILQWKDYRTSLLPLHPETSLNELVNGC